MDTVTKNIEPETEAPAEEPISVVIEVPTAHVFIPQLVFGADQKVEG